MAILGYINQLTIVKTVEFGVYLDGGELGEVLMPKRYVPEDATDGDEIEAFLYLDSEDRPVATTETPALTLGQCATLKVVDVNKVGAFLDWGLSKDLMVPFGEQAETMRLGKSYVVTTFLDDRTGRIVASSRLDKHLAEQSIYHKLGQAVELIIASETDLGFKVVVDNKFLGLLFRDEAPRQMKPGEKVSGFIKQIRSDGKMDVSMRPAKPEKVYQTLSEQIIQHLQDNDGTSTITDKSSPSEILEIFGVSKGSYKKTLGHLYKLKKIQLEKDKITLL